MSEILVLKNAQNNSELKIQKSVTIRASIHSRGVYKVWVGPTKYHLVFKDDSLNEFIRPEIQGSLFGVEDYTEGIKSRNAGMEKVEKSANEADPEWGEKAIKVFRNFVNMLPPGKDFMTEDVRVYAENNSLLPNPPSRKAWGPVTNKLAKEGFIRRVGFASVKNPKANMAPVGVWVKNV